MKKILFVALLLVSSLHASVTSQTDKSATVVITALPQVVPATFPFQASADLQVLDFGSVATPRDPAVVLTLGSDYTVTGGGYNNANQMQLGSVVVASGGAHLVLVNDRLIVRRNVPINQITSFMTTGPLTMKQAEQALDKQATLSQQINEVTTRSLQFENFETLSPILSLASRKGMLLGFDSTGAIAYTPTGTTPGSYVSKIIAGTNVTISPTTGIGDVTINASGGGGSGTINAGTVNNIAYYSGSTTINSVTGTVAGSNGISYSSADTSKTFQGLYNTSTGGKNWELRSNGQSSGLAGAFSIYNSGGAGLSVSYDGSSGAQTTYAVNTIDLSSGTLPSVLSSSVTSRVSAADGFGPAAEGISFGANAGYIIAGRAVGGTRAAQTATADTATLVGLQGYGYGTALTTTNPARFYINADGLWSGTNNGALFLWSAAPSGSTTRADWMKLQNGSLQLLAGGVRSTGPTITDANAMAALAIDVTKGLNTKTVAVDSTLTFSATPATANTYFTIRLTNSDTNPHVITIPSTFDSNSQQTITTFNILAGGVETISWCYDGTNYIAYGVPSSGSSAEVTVASATTTAIGAASSVNVAISGTTTITSFGTIAAGTYRQGRFTGALTLTYNATSMILPSGASITTAAGDTFAGYSLGSGNWLVTDYNRASGKALVFPNLATDGVGILPGTNGGTGVNNSTRTLTYAGNVAFTGAFNVSFTVPGAFTYVLPAAADTLVGRASTDTLTNKRVTARTTTITSSATPAFGPDTTDELTITAQAAAITSMSSGLTGTPNNGDQILIRIKDNGTARAITWGTSYQSIGGTLPTTTVVSKLLYVLVIYNSTDAKYDCVSTSQQP